jgi:hypothetical protein
MEVLHGVERGCRTTRCCSTRPAKALLLQTQAPEPELEAAHAGNPPELGLAEGYIDDHFHPLKIQRLSTRMP